MSTESIKPLTDLAPYLHFMVEQGGSDLFLTCDAAPALKVQGIVHPVNLPVFQTGQVKTLAYSIMRESQIKEFERNLECDLAIAIPNLGRFRFNMYMQRGEVAMVVRHINARIPSIDELRLPNVLKSLIMEKRGLILIVGAAGSGKSSTLAAMLDHRNTQASGHILTIEDPIEFEHHHHKAIVDQREVGLDTHTFEDALRHAMREAPDVIMIGEIRDSMTMTHAMTYAETGHLCISTLHSNNANQAIERILNFFPEESRHQALLDLSLNLRGIVAQRLIRAKDGKLVPAVEVLLQSPYVADLIQKGQIELVKDVMAKSNELGMQTFDQSLYDLYQRGLITVEQALDHADSRTDLSLRMRLSAGATANLSGLGIRPELI